MTHQTVRFILAGQIEELSNCEPTRTVLEFLREDRALKGTKEGCAEGDCGACTVVIGELHNGEIRYRAVNSCIQFLPSLDGKQLLTVEDLDQAGETGLHAVQQAMVDQHGSQCGFCTPGFIMSLFAMYHSQPERDISRADIELGLAGNLCRCTGYAPIVRAAEQVLNAGRADRFTTDSRQTVEMLKRIQPAESLQVQCESGAFYSPGSCSEVCELLQNHPDAVLVAGATDVGLWVTKQNRRLETVIYLGEVSELRNIEAGENHLSIGSAVTYSDAARAIGDVYPAFLPLIERIGAIQVRNAGTIGGNIANGSPIGDMPPGLIAIGAKILLRSSQGQRLIDLEEYFISYGKQDLRPGEFIEQILLPLPPADQQFATYKVSKRFEQDISAVCAAFAMQVKDGIINQARVCYGGMAEIPARANNCEQYLTGKPWNQDTINGAQRALLEDYTPITDMRASAKYRMRVAQNLVQRFYLEQTTPAFPVRLGSEIVPGHIDRSEYDG
jgi:xanthine dehydrogenase small subunit